MAESTLSQKAPFTRTELNASFKFKPLSKKIAFEKFD